MTIDFKLGQIEPRLGDGQKFLITREGNSLIYHAKVDLYFPNCVDHAEIARDLRLQGVIGGGSTRIPIWDQKTLLVTGHSDFGGMPSEIMAGFSPLLLEFYKRIAPKITRVKISTHSNYSFNRWLETKNLDFSDNSLGEIK